MNRLLVLTLGVLTAFGLHAKPCEGRWNVKVENSNVSYVGSMARIPVFIQISKSMRDCAPQGIYVRSNVNQGAIASSTNGELQGWITDANGSKRGYETQRGVVFPIGRNEQTKLWIEFPGAANAPPGKYTSQLFFSLVGVDSISPVPETVQFRVKPYVEMKINGQDKRVTTVNFGTLTSYEAKTLNLYLKSNTRVGLLFDAENEKLKHRKIHDAYVPYTLYLNNQKVLFDSMINLNRLNRNQASTRPLMIKIGDTSQARAGSYSDVVTITAIAKP